MLEGYRPSHLVGWMLVGVARTLPLGSSAGARTRHGDSVLMRAVPKAQPISGFQVTTRATVARHGARRPVRAGHRGWACGWTGGLSVVSETLVTAM